MVDCGQWQLQCVPVASLALGRACTLASAHLPLHQTQGLGHLWMLGTLLALPCPAHHGEGTAENPCSLWLATCHLPSVPNAQVCSPGLTWGMRTILLVYRADK